MEAEVELEPVRRTKQMQFPGASQTLTVSSVLQTRTCLLTAVVCLLNDRNRLKIVYLNSTNT